MQLLVDLYAVLQTTSYNPLHATADDDNTAAMKRTLDPDDPNTSPKRQPLNDGNALKARYREPGDLLLTANPQDPIVLQALIDRSLAVALHSAGFNAVKKDAFESMRNAMDSYFTHLTRRVALSMRSSRRIKPIPHDFQYALGSSNVSLNSLLPDVKPAAQKRPPSIKAVRQTTQPPLFPRAPASSTACEFDFSAVAVLAAELGGTADKDHRQYIPKHFPPFPPPHTYKATAVPVSERESDARKIRERATQEGVLAERALRKLVKARKTGSRPPSRIGGAAVGAIPRDELFYLQAVQSVAQEDQEKGRESLQEEDEMLFLDEGEEHRKSEEKKEAQVPDLGADAVVNYDRGHWRSGARDIFGVG